MREEELVELLHKRLSELCVGKSIQLLTHWGGDADSIGSSYVLSKIIKSRYGGSATGLAIPEEPTTHSRAIMSRFGIREELLARPDLYVAVDVGSEEQLGGIIDVIRSSGVPFILIDHHLRESKGDPRIEYFTSGQYQATAEIIYDLAQHIGWRLDADDAAALFLGIYYDTVRLSVADAVTTAKVCALLSRGVVPGEVLSGLESVMDESERLARIRAALRMRAYKVGEWIILCSEVSAYQSATSRALLALGAHLAMVGGQDGDIANISLRATSDFVRATNVGVGDRLVQLILQRFGGSGGGHRNVGRVRCRGRLEEVYSHVVRHLSLMLGVGHEELAE